MSELYSSESGSYESYLSQRQVDQITTTIKQSTDIQMMGMAATTGVLGAKLDSMNAKLKVIGTGLYTAVSKNTLQIAASTSMLQKTFKEGFDAVNNRLDLGFAGITSEIGAMSAAMTAGFDQMKVTLDYWGNEICDKLDAIHDIVNNPLLTASRELYRRAVSNAKKQFFEEALEDIKGAVEKNKTDYISWGLMGRIYLFGVSEFSKTIDVPKALEAFNNACKYISPDVDESEDAKKMAAEYYFYAAYANYILANESRIANKAEDVKKYLEDSIKANAKSYALSNTMYEALYDKARAYSLLEQKENALKALEEAIRADGLYSVKVLGDPDFKWLENDIVTLITNLRDETYTELQSIKPKVLKVVDEYEFMGGSFCEFVKDAAMTINDIKEDTAYLDIRNNYERNTLLLNSINNNSIPYEQIYDFYEGHDDVFGSILENLTDVQRKIPLLPIDGVEIDTENLEDYTLHVKHFYKFLYKDEIDKKYRSLDRGGMYDASTAYELSVIQDKYFTPSLKFFITNKTKKDKDGKEDRCGGCQRIEDLFFSDYYQLHEHDHELVYEYDKFTKMIFTYVLKTGSEYNEKLENEIRNYKQNIKVYQRVMVPKQYLKQVETKENNELNSVEAVRKAKEAEEETQKREMDRQYEEYRLRMEKKDRRTTIEIISLVSVVVISFIIGFLVHHPFFGGIIGAAIAFVIFFIDAIINGDK